MEKESLRLKYRKQRRSLKKDEKEVADRGIFKLTAQIIPWNTVRNMHVYRATTEELGTKLLIKFIQNEKSQVVLTIPEEKDSTPPEGVEYDVIIVPGLAFDHSGYRLGYGGGYYDRLLANQKKALKIGLCYRMNLSSKNLPRESHDMPVDIIVTETDTYFN